MSKSDDEPTKAELAQRINDLEDRIDSDDAEPDTKTDDDGGQSMVSRRDAIKAGGLLAALGIAPSVASAQQIGNGSSCEWNGNIDANGYNLQDLGVLEFEDGTTMSSAASGGGGSALWEDANDNGLLSPAQSNDTGIDVQDAEIGSVSADAQAGSHSVLIDSATKLDNLDSNLSQGDVALVEQPDTPYRTTSWLDIDTNDVDVLFESKWARNGDPIVMAADGSSSGGVRIGSNNYTENVTVNNFGWHGNRQNVSSDNVARHGVHILDAYNIKINRSYVVNTAPNRLDSDYSTQAQGIYADTQSRFVQFNFCVAEDAGNDGFSTTGKWIEANSCISHVNINRGLSTVGHANTNQGSNIEINGGIYTGGSFPASAIGVGFDGSGENVTINGPLLRGGLVSDQHGVTVRKGASNVTVNGAVADGFAGNGYSVENQRGPTEDVTFNGCVSTNCSNAIWIKGGTNVSINGGTFKNEVQTNYPFIIDASGTKVNNVTIESNGKAGISVDADGIKCENNDIKNFGSRGGFFLQSGTDVVLSGNTGTPEDSSAEWMKWDGDCRPVLKDNVLEGSCTAYSASNSSHLPSAAVNNDPGYVFSTVPTSPINYHPYIAGTGWDPDGDSDAELVVTDDEGSTWQEIVALPNT
jgi:uncharacterized protein YcfJ